MKFESNVAFGARNNLRAVDQRISFDEGPLMKGTRVNNSCPILHTYR
jgi:hypothetical protein